jgi:CheY-like chemotaxis protein
MISPLKHILLADDDPDDIEFFQSALEDTCPDVALIVAEDGSDLLDRLECGPLPGLIVLDINMPRKSGKTCLTEIRLNKRYDAIPVIMLSTSHDKEDIDYCLANGANKYFVKAFTFTDTKKMVEEICAGLLVIHP